MIAPRVTVLLVFALLTFQVPALAEDEPAQSSPWQPFFHTMAGDYRIAPADAPEQTFRLLEAPVLRWSQPVRGGDDGAVYLWLDGRRPAVIGTIFAWPFRDGKYVVTNELHSLHTTPLTAEWRDRDVWRPTEPGLRFQPVPEAPAPASSEKLRLTQMRALARRFDGVSIDGEGARWELRLLPQPLYRYPQSEDPVALLDGALFALVQGTDPEVLVLLEAHQDGDQWRWEYALARFSDRPLRVRYAGSEVWTVEQSQPYVTKPYHVFNADQREPPTGEDR